MEDLLKQILDKINSLEKRMDNGFTNLNDRIDSHDKSNKEEYKQINKRLDGITEVVAQTMECVTELKDKVEKQEVEIKVIKGGKAQ